MKYIALLLFLGSSSLFFGQSNDAFTHRALLVNTNSEPRSLENFEAEVKLIKNPQDLDEVSYAETHSIKTDSLGWYSIKIGSGKVITVNNSLSDVDWSSGKTYLNIRVTDTLGTLVSQGITEILSSPKISFAKDIDSRALLTLDCLTNLEALRNFPVPADGEMICVKGHSSVRDGGEGFFFYKSEMLEADDDGIIIRPKDVYSDRPGRWVRKLDGYININYYGLTAGRSANGVNNYLRIQRAVDFAANNRRNDHRLKSGEISKGNTIFFPNGTYSIDGSVKLYNGVGILGEENTMLTAKQNADFDYFFTIGGGRVTISIKDLWLNGNKSGSVGGMYFKAQPGEDGTGGLWQSRFTNINILNIQGHGIHLEGGDSMGLFGANDYSLPNQFNVFENIRVTRLNDDKNSLRMTQYQGQHTFINCLLVGKRDRKSLGANVFISNSGGNVVTFLNCTIQEAIHGFKMENSSSITIDNCWFENLYNAIDVTGGRSINVINSRFANSAGYGSEGHTGPERIPDGVGPGSIISSENSSVNVERNYVLVSNPREPSVEASYFIYGRFTEESGLNTNNINARANNFKDGVLSRTRGVVPEIPVALRTILLGGRTNVMAAFDGTTVLRNIESFASGGEQISLTIRKERGRGIIKIKDWGENSRRGNISLNGEDQIELSNGQTVTFLKVDPPAGENGNEPIYKLVTVSN